MKQNSLRKAATALCLLSCLFPVMSQAPQGRRMMEREPSYSIHDGKVDYTTDARGNRIPDFSYSGYRASEEDIPELPVKAYVACPQGDATAQIQGAIDYVSSLPADASGFRGAVLLGPGTFRLEGGLKIAASGVVLRGSGCFGDNMTEILAVGDDRTTVLRIAGRNDRKQLPSIEMTAPAPTGTMFIIAANHQVKEGSDILIKRLGTLDWAVNEMDMYDFGGESSYIGWHEGDVDVYWDRKVTRVSGDTLFLDAPLTCEIRLGEGSFCPYTWEGRIYNSGVENIRFTSTYDERYPLDENHRWEAVELDNIMDAWVRRMEFRHFAGSAVIATDRSRRVTVEDCKSLEPVSEIAGQRRYSFYTIGSQTLFQRLYSEYGMHDFAVGRLAPGPNAFVQCFAYRPNHFSGCTESWATGVLFDSFVSEGGGLSFANRGQDGMGAGWTAGNCMIWNCTASFLAMPQPPTAYNWANGTWGTRYGNIRWSGSDGYANPQAFFYTQLAQRLGRNMDERAGWMPFDTQSASNPPIDKAQEFVAEARRPALTIREWMDTLMIQRPLDVRQPSRKMASVWKKYVKEPVHVDYPATHLEHGVLVRDGKILTGRSQGIVWWNGSLRDRYLKANAQPHITRWVPGREGTGYTDNLEDMTDAMVARHVLATDHHYALWYERRRDDHERIRRMDGYVWAPFYELPFARSSQGTAYDGLSQYDLTRWNTWYWNRLKTYADLADQKGLLLYQQHYFQHNILEAGAHYADFPWRTANNINNTGFPEPVPFAGDKRVYMSEHFYDVDHPVRRELHRNYIRKCLDNFADNGSVVHFISAEFTGPLHFVQFWIDVIAEWEAETGKDALVALSCTKDVQDAILEDPVRSKTVDIIDIRYWNPGPNGTYSSPVGGLAMAPRQYGRVRGGTVQSKVMSDIKLTGDAAYDAIHDYRTRYPEKAVIYSTGGDAWSCFMATASCCGLPAGLPNAFLRESSQMEIIDNENNPVLGKPGLGYLVRVRRQSQAVLDLTGDKTTYKARWIDERSGNPASDEFEVKGGQIVKEEGNGVLWLYR